MKTKVCTRKIGGSNPPLGTMYKDIIYTNDKAYQIKRTLREDMLNNPDTSLLKKWFHCDTLLKSQGKLYFCNLIPEMEYEEIE